MNLNMNQILKIAIMILMAIPAVYVSAISVSADNDMVSISRLSKMRPMELLDSADSYADKSSFDIALSYYNMVINYPYGESLTREEQVVRVKALNGMAAIYGHMSDYRSSFELLIRALTICDENSLDEEKSSIYNNIGNIYYSCKKYTMANSYYSAALKQCRDSSNEMLILNNLMNVGLESGKTDSIEYWLEKSKQVNEKSGGKFTYLILNSTAFMYKLRGDYDSAFYYYRKALEESRRSNNPETEASVLSVLGDMYLTTGHPDSARIYIAMSDKLVEANEFRAIMSDNKLILSRIEDADGHVGRSLELYKEYVALKDSILGLSQFSEITQRHRLYEVSKTNRIIEEMVLKHRIKEQAISYQKRISAVIVLLLLISIGFLVFVVRSKRKLGKAYEVLVKKNVEIMELHETQQSDEGAEKEKKVSETILQSGLVEEIKRVMDEPELICDPKFSISRLSELVGSNRTYVSSVINSVYGKNFRSFLNERRIQIAQRIFASSDAVRFTIESVASRVGFKSPTAFRDAFKDVTGVTPSVYVKYLLEEDGK